MRTKDIALRFVPPIFFDAIWHLKNRGRDRRLEWEYMAEGWKTRDDRIKGWNIESIVETQKAKWTEFLGSVRSKGPLGVSHEAPSPSVQDYAAHNTIMAFAYVLALAARNKEQLSLLDWGGGLGHYFEFAKNLLPDVKIDYYCKDVPLLCEGGRELQPDGHFIEEDDETFRRTYDLVMASTSMHYSEDWKSVAERLASVSRPYLYITRLPIVHHTDSFVVVQRPYAYGYETEYMGWFLNRAEFLYHMEKQGVDLMREFLIQERPFVHRAPEQGEYRGYLFRSSGNG